MENPIETAVPAQSLSGAKILWVEDDKFLSELVARKLANEHAELIHASNGEEAFSVLATASPDIVMLDILLPGLSGFEILERIRNNPKTKDVPIIMLSNLGQKEEIEKGKKLGATKFLIKATVTLDEIVAEIRKVPLSKAS
jgi:DNA-binding response OmpR family regulator